MTVIDEFVKSCSDLDISYDVLDAQSSDRLIQGAFTKFGPVKSSGHLSISEKSAELPIAGNEFTYSLRFDDQAVVIFFDQEVIPRKAIRVARGQKLCQILENCYGMEYFVTDDCNSFLIAVNWYAIEGSGRAKEWFGGPKRGQT